MLGRILARLVALSGQYVLCIYRWCPGCEGLNISSPCVTFRGPALHTTVQSFLEACHRRDRSQGRGYFQCRQLVIAIRRSLKAGLRC